MKAKRVLSDNQKLDRTKKAFKRKIKKVFTGAGFEYVATNNHELSIGLRKEEIDSLYIYENIWLLCEDTVNSGTDRDHIRTKSEAFKEIKNNKFDFIKTIIELFPEQNSLFTSYEVSRIELFMLYIPSNEIVLQDSDFLLFEDLKFVNPSTLDYFSWIVKVIMHSARNEIFRYLGIKDDQIGNPLSSSDIKQISAPIIYPQEFTGLKNNVRVVSFMMSAEDMLNTCYVLRKDNWEESIWLYQRLIGKSKIASIRSFLEKKGEAFYNNIIVALPDDVSFTNSKNEPLSIDKISSFDGNYKLVIPKKMNSICIIDGQHRVFAHYKSGTNSDQEKTITRLRKQLHLLVTGLIFPKDMPKEECARIQSKIFLDINSNAKPVPQNILLHIKRISNPIADESIAQSVIECLNKKGPFFKRFKLSELDAAPIKTASIVRFALRYLVTSTPSEGKTSLFNYWEGDKNGFQDSNYDSIKNYVEFCSKQICMYFNAIKEHFNSEWENKASKILSVISINGFIIAYNRQLRINGLKEYEYFQNLFSTVTFDFSNKGFPYTSSQYRKFSNEILKEVFKFSDDIIDQL